MTLAKFSLFLVTLYLAGTLFLAVVIFTRERRTKS